ncbi:MAG TPA: prepilin peptidase [Acidimicrobiia bacterium]|nr:prepilin peptidase [Acidimicrobiia bacterium]
MPIAIAAVFGLLVGSFLNVVAYRIPAGRSVVRPGSACPKCGTPIAGVDNVPLLSWIVLRGRCRHCGVSISARYPIVEAATAGLFAATTAIVGFGPLLPAYLWFVAVTFVLAIVDLDTKRLPNRILYPGTAVALVLLIAGTAFEGNWQDLGRGALGGLAYFAGLFALAIVARGGFGFGDVKLAFLLGLFVARASWGALGVAVLGAFFLGGMVGVALLVTRRAGRKSAIPFGPVMVLAAWLAIALGERIAAWYLG